MKSKFYFLALLFLSIYQVSAQDPITVSGTCSDSEALGVYNYDGDINGKPSYRKGVLLDCTEYDEATCEAPPKTYLIKWNGSAWEWSSDFADCVWLVQLCVPKSVSGEDPSTILANNTGDTTVPTCTGWVATAEGCVPDITTGCESLSVIQNTFSSNIALYPNPTNGNISIDLGNINSSISVRLTNLIGKVIWTKDFNNTSSIQFEINQPTGIYLIELTGENGEKAYLKMVKE